MLSNEKYATSTFRNAEGENIFYRNWKSNGDPKAILLIVHGLNSHSGYYQNFALQLNEANFGVYAIDLPGHGQSDGDRYYISDYKTIVEDIDELLKIAKSTHPALPIFLLGHSAGGVFASVYAVQHQQKLRGLISESSAFQIPAPAFALAFMKFMAIIIPHTRLVKLRNQDFSRDKSVVDKMNNDPLLAKEKQPVKTMQQLILAAEYLKTKMHEIKIPLLILHGTADKVTMPRGSEYFMEHTSSADKQLKLYEGYYHDLLNDKYNGMVVQELVIWLCERV